MERWSDSWNKWWRRLVSPEQGEAKGGEEGEPKFSDRSGRVRYLALLLLVGAGLMILANPREAGEEAVGPPALPANGAALVQSNSDGFVDELERQVTLAVSQIAGVGDVVVTIVPATSQVMVLAEEITERESESTGADVGDGGVRYERSVTRRPVTVTGEDGRRQEPVLLYTRSPEIAGVLVVADGAREPAIRYLIVRAVSTALGIPPHKVEAVPKRE